MLHIPNHSASTIPLPRYSRAASMTDDTLIVSFQSA
jgi:hypothetical protein